MTTSAPIYWTIPIYRGLFRPAGERVVRATSRFEAECLGQEHLDPGEWFPSFSATPVTSILTTR